MTGGRVRVAVPRRAAERQRVLAEVLPALRRWFGQARSRRRYVEQAPQLLVIAALAGRSTPVGFLCLRRTSPAAAEIYVMGVLPDRQRKGIGRLLVERAEAAARQAGAAFLTVKALGASYPDPAYAASRAFYASVGFLPLEEYPDFWGKGMPCLLLAKSLAAKEKGRPKGGLLHSPSRRRQRE